MRNLLLSVLVMTLATCPLLAAEPAPTPAPEPKAIDLKNLPANQWVERPTSGWAGKTYYGNVLTFGFCSAGELGVVVFSPPHGLYRKPDPGEKPGTTRVLRLDAASGAWSEHAASPLEVAFKGGANDGSPPLTENLHGMQLCYDPDRKVLVGLTATDLDGRGRTVEFDLEAKKVTGLKPNPSPPVVTAASLCYDPVNKEVVLATGGFSPVGGTDGTWLYDGAKKEWRRLAGPKEVEEVRLPAEALRDRLIVLRWLVWKNLEFRATGREKLLDERSTGAALAKESASLVTDLTKLGELAAANAGKAERPYHNDRLASAGKLLTGVAGKLGGLDAKLKSASPEELEAVYRSTILPAVESAEAAICEVAVTPEPRMSARLVYDSKNKLMVCFGGDSQDRVRSDTWVYHCEGRWWERRQPKTHPAGGPSRAMAYDAKNGVTVRLESIVSNGYHKGWTVWCYDAAANYWKLTGVKASPELAWLEFDPVAGYLVGLNGNLGGTAWLLRLDLASAPLAEAKPAAADPIVPPPPTGDFVLRDAATLADLKKWQAEQDAWAKGVPANTWVKVPTNGTGRPNWGRSWSSIVYDSDRQQIYYRDGGHGSYHGAVTDHYDIPTGRWFRSDRCFNPPWPMGSYFGWGRSFSLAPWAVHTYKYGLFYNPLTKRLNRTIGQSGGMEGSGPDTVLEYDPDTGRWAREGYRLADLKDWQWVLPGAPDRLIRISPWTRYNPKTTTAVWQRTAGGEKTWPSTGFLPYQDFDAGLFFDSKRNRAMFYGGPNDKAELLALDLNAGEPKWQKLAVTAEGGKLPLASREIVYVSRHDDFLMLGRSPESKDLEVWSLDAKENLFRRVPLAKGPGVQTQDAGVSQGLQYDPVTDLCYYCGIATGYRIMWYAFRYTPEKGTAQ